MASYSKATASLSALPLSIQTRQEIVSNALNQIAVSVLPPNVCNVRSLISCSPNSALPPALLATMEIKN